MHRGGPSFSSLEDCAPSRSSCCTWSSSSVCAPVIARPKLHHLRICKCHSGRDLLDLRLPRPPKRSHLPRRKHPALGSMPLSEHTFAPVSSTDSPQENNHSLVIPKITVQDFSAEDGLVCHKPPECDPTHALERRRRPSWARISTPFGGHLTVAVRSSFRLQPTPGKPAVEGPRPGGRP